MALIECRECKQQISDQAQTCPHCGAPVHPAPPVTSVPPARPARGGLISVVALIGLIIVALIAYRLWHPQLQKAGIVASPRFAVDNAGGNEDCTTLGDYCVRVRCAVTNIGDADGIARIGADFSEDNKVVATHRATTQMLIPGQHDTLTMDFPEATLASTQHQYRCYPEQ